MRQPRLDAARLISGWSRLVDADDSSREIRHISMALVNRVKRNFDQNESIFPINALAEMSHYFDSAA
jgi:hypothetical protein